MAKRNPVTVTIDEGKVQDEVRTFELSDGRTGASFRLSTYHGKKDGDNGEPEYYPSMFIDVVTFNDFGGRVRALKVGDRVSLQGILDPKPPYTNPDTGQTRYDNQIIIGNQGSWLHRLNDPEWVNDGELVSVGVASDEEPF